MLTGYKLREKVTLFSPKFQAIAHPHRLAILHLLSYGELPLHEIVSSIDLPQNLISHHIKQLEQTNWIDKRKEGKETFYILKDRNFFELFRMIIESPFYRNILIKRFK